MTKKAKPLPAPAPARTDLTAAEKSQAALLPEFNAAFVIAAYQGNIMGDDASITELIGGLQKTLEKSKEGDLHRLEDMLLGQATALQTIFTSLARRATQQEYVKNYDSFLSLALKAQAQSRATIQAVIDLKYPKQIAFVKQANISHGPQQVNNGSASHDLPRSESNSHARKIQTQQNKLLEGDTHGGTYLDAGTTTTASGRNPTLEAVGAVCRADKR